MKPEKAIKSIQEHNRIHFEKEKGKCPIITEALRMAISALEKQIPKKPIEKPTKCFFAVLRCPNCNTLIARHQKYCNDFGQALDWS